MKWLNSYWSLPVLFCFALLYFNTNSLTNVLEVEGSRSRLAEDSILTSLFLVYSAYIVVLLWVRKSIPFFLMLVVVGLIGTWSIYLLVCICILCIVYTFLLLGTLSLLFVIYIFHARDLCFSSVCLLFSFEMILSRFHLNNNINFCSPNISLDR